MNGVFEHDPARGPGYGLIRLSGLPTLPAAPEFTLQRGSDRLFLGTDGWYEAQKPCTPVACRAEGDTLVLSVAPDVVDQLDSLEKYRITLFGAGDPVVGLLQIRSLVPSLLVGSGSMGVAPTPPPAPAATPPLPDPVPAPPPVEPATPEPLVMAAAPTGGNRWLWPVGLGLLVLGAAAGGWWYYAQQSTSAATPATSAATTPAGSAAGQTNATAPATPAAPSTPATSPEAASPAPAATPATPANSETAATAATPPASGPGEAQAPAPRSAREQAQTFLRGAGTPAQAIQLARSLPTATPDDQDAVFLLMEMAAAAGQPEAMLRIGQYYNPASTTPAGTIIKDPEQALLWLKQAAAKPETAEAAKAALADLKRWLQSSGGDAAARLLQSME